MNNYFAEYRARRISKRQRELLHDVDLLIETLESMEPIERQQLSGVLHDALKHSGVTIAEAAQGLRALGNVANKYQPGFKRVQ